MKGDHWFFFIDRQRGVVRCRLNPWRIVGLTKRNQDKLLRKIYGWMLDYQAEMPEEDRRAFFIWRQEVYEFARKEVMAAIKEKS